MQLIKANALFNRRFYKYDGIFRKPAHPASSGSNGSDDGFSLIEVVVSLTILLVALLGVFYAFTWAIIYNAGNNSRSQALALTQQEVERLRSAKFTPTVVDTTLTGGVKPVRVITMPNSNSFRLTVSVDDDPVTPGLQISSTSTVKEVTVGVALDRPTPGWQASVPAIMILRRVRAN